MKCVICRQAELREGKATVTLQRGATTLVGEGVPARVCPNCGEEYVEEAVSQELMKSAEDAVRAGVQVDVREYAVA